MAFTEAQIIEAARARIGNKPDVAVGEHLIPRVAIVAEMRSAIDECCRAFGASSVAKRKTFRTAQRPRLATPASPTVTPAESGGILGPGTYSYRISATVEGGETLAGAAATATIAGTTGSTSLSWGSVAGATAYVVYGRTAGSEQWLAAVEEPAWTDTGKVATAGSAPTADTTNAGWLQEYDVSAYVGDDVLSIGEVLRSGACRSDQWLPGDRDEIDARGVPVGSPGYLNQGHQRDVMEVIVGQARWRHQEQYEWSVVRRGATLYLQLTPPPTNQELIEVGYLSTASSIAALPDSARAAVENAACCAILNCVLNRVDADPSFMVGSQAERRDKQEVIKLIERQRDRYQSLFRTAVNRRRG